MNSNYLRRFMGAAKLPFHEFLSGILLGDL